MANGWHETEARRLFNMFRDGLDEERFVVEIIKSLRSAHVMSAIAADEDQVCHVSIYLGAKDTTASVKLLTRERVADADTMRRIANALVSLAAQITRDVDAATRSARKA